jgi:2-dehydropantoate 2-reductase
MARVAIVGVGAIGGALAGHLARTGRHQITLCRRRPVDAADGALLVHLPEGDVLVKGLSVSDPAQAPPVVWVIVTTKTYDAEGAAKWFPRLGAEGARVAVVQNGVEHRERFAPYLSADRLLPVVIDCPTERKRDGSINVRGGTLMKVEDEAMGQEFAKLFEGSAVKMDLVADFTTAAWWKLCINAPGALNALTLKPASVLWTDEMSRVAIAMVDECVAVGRAEGAKLDDGMGEFVMSLYRKHPADSINSILADRMAGRQMETDARNGAIVRKGEKHGIATPLNRMAVALLNAV